MRGLSWERAARHAAPAAATSAPAQPLPSTLAKASFAEGLERLGKGDWAGACRMFDASMKEASSPSTAVRLADCDDHEHEGHKPDLAAAWAHLQLALELNALTQDPKRRDDIDKAAQKRLQKLLPRVPRLRIRVAGAPTELSVRCDGKPLAASELQQLLADHERKIVVNPGVHQIDASAPGHVDFHEEVTLLEGQERALDLVLTPVPERPPPAPAPVPEPPRPVQAPVAATKPPSGAARRTAGVVVGDLGFAAASVGAVFWVRMQSKLGDLAPLCYAGYARCKPEAGPILDEARRLRAAAIVLSSVGAAALGTGIVLYATAPRATAVRVSVVPGGLSLEGRW